MKRQEESHWFKAIRAIVNEHHARTLGSVNIEHLLACWQIGGVLSAKIKHDGWGRATIDRLVDFIHVHAPEEKGYGRSNLYSMVAVYEAFSSEEFMALVSKYEQRLIVQPVAGQIRSDEILEALDRDVRRSNENPSIGILLCKSADRSVVEYALSRTMSPAMVAEYKRMLIPKEVLQETFESYLDLTAPRKNARNHPNVTVAAKVKKVIGK